jgi:hypothetical protein
MTIDPPQRPNAVFAKVFHPALGTLKIDTTTKVTPDDDLFIRAEQNRLAVWCTTLPWQDGPGKPGDFFFYLDGHGQITSIEAAVAGDPGDLLRGLKKYGVLAPDFAVPATKQ